VSTPIATAARSNNITTTAIFFPVDQNGELLPLEPVLPDPAVATTVVVVDEEVVVLEVLAVELVVVLRWVVDV
jgi:hypothetical protein